MTKMNRIMLVRGFLWGLNGSWRKQMLHSQEPISHLEFCKRICLAWLDPHNNWPRHVKLAARDRDREQTSQASAERSVTTSSRNSLSTISTRSSAKNFKQNKRARRLTDSSLHPTNGSLNDWLHQVQYWPIATSVSREWSLSVTP